LALGIEADGGEGGVRGEGEGGEGGVAEFALVGGAEQDVEGAVGQGCGEGVAVGYGLEA